MFLSPGDKILTSEKTFIGIYTAAQGVGAQIETVPLTQNARFDVEGLA